MAISATPFALQNVPINADVVREAVSSLLPNAGGVVQSGDFAVAQTTVASMAVTVGVGRAWIRGTEVTNLAGQSYGKQGEYFVMNDASVTLTINPADNTNPRIDVVYIAIQDATYSGVNNAAVLAVAQGAATPTPAVPTIPNNAIAIAQVAVAANASSIITANITSSNPALAVTPPNTLQNIGTGDATWGYNCQLFTEYDLQGHKMVTFQCIIARVSGGAFSVAANVWTSLLTGLIPAGYRPTDDITVSGTYEFAPSTTPSLGPSMFKITTGGNLYAAGANNAFSCGTPTKLSFTAVWKTA